ncbi:hypothetical protein, partial [Endozoicomonas sp. SESOKO2]|uniref:hypothetical protein n=1 Tax=Endozoicomonas sp. SESOKO2 TaxID=2828743 RepID=UPI0021498837
KADRMVANLGPDLLSGNLGPDIYVIHRQANGTRIIDRDNGNTLILHGVQTEKLDWRLTENYTHLEVLDDSQLFFTLNLRHVPRCLRNDKSLATGLFINSLAEHFWRLVTVDPANNGTNVLTSEKLWSYYYSRLAEDNRLDNIYQLDNVTAPVRGGPGDDLFFISGTVKPGAGLFGESGNDIFHIKSSGASVHPGLGSNLVSLELEGALESAEKTGTVKIFFAPSSFNRVHLGGASLTNLQAASWRSLAPHNATDATDSGDQPRCPAGLSRLMPPPVTGGSFILAGWVHRSLPSRAWGSLIHFAGADGADAIRLSLKNRGLEIRLTDGERIFHDRVRPFFTSPPPTSGHDNR